MDAAARAPRDRLRVVVPRYGEGIAGGAETAMRRLARAMAARGWAVEVLTTTALDEATWSPGFAAGTEEDGGVTVRRFDTVHGRSTRWFPWAQRVALRAPWLPGAGGAFVRLQGPVAPGLIRALGDQAAPTVFHPYLFHPVVAGLPVTRGTRILAPAAHDEPALRLRAVRRAVLAADALWFNTPEERDLVVATHPAAAATPWAVGLAGVERPANIDVDGFARRHGLEPGTWLYHGGRRSAAKAVGMLVGSLATVRRTHPGVQLVLSGTGERVDAAGVVDTGWLSEADRWAAVAGALAVVVPGTLESLSLLAVEAGAAGRPALLNRCSPVLAGLARRSGGALLFGDEAELARAITVLADDPAAAERLGRAGAAHVATAYTWDGVEARLRELIAGARR